MRNKVILIRGHSNISPQITSAAFERLNADNVLVMAALRYPQYMPDPWNRFSINTSTIGNNAFQILDYIRAEGYEHCLSAQYAETATERGLESIRVVEGNVLEVDWFYSTVKNYHKNFGQSVCVCELQYHHKDHVIIGNIDGVLFTKKELIERLGHSSILD